jgi:hypothetical protein
MANAAGFFFAVRKGRMARRADVLQRDGGRRKRSRLHRGNASAGRDGRVDGAMVQRHKQRDACERVSLDQGQTRDAP